MDKYRNKPVIIEAEQLLVHNINKLEIWCGGSIKGMRLLPSERCIDIQTPEGECRAEIGDFIIKGIKGEFYSCKPDFFKKTYEKIEE